VWAVAGTRIRVLDPAERPRSCQRGHGDQPQALATVN
jgi:hypothetical protein